MEELEKKEKAVDEELIRKTVTTDEIERILAEKIRKESKPALQNPQQKTQMQTHPQLQNQNQTHPLAQASYSKPSTEMDEPKPISTSIHNSHGKPIILSVGKEKFLDESICPDCKGRGIIIESSGLAHTCWKCLSEGRLDVHSKNIPVSKIKL